MGPNDLNNPSNPNGFVQQMERNATILQEEEPTQSDQEKSPSEASGTSYVCQHLPRTCQYASWNPVLTLYVVILVILVLCGLSGKQDRN